MINIETQNWKTYCTTRGIRMQHTIVHKKKECFQYKKLHYKGND